MTNEQYIYNQSLISRVLLKAHENQENSILCPYLAIALETNFISKDFIRTFPSQFGRM